MSSRSKTVCEICGESFLTENKLSNHITERHVHSSTSPSASVGSSSKRRKLDADSDVRCPLCDYVDLDTDRLQQHVNRMHFDPGSPRRPGTVDFPCPICPLAFDHCDSLETHINEEHHDIVSPQSDSDSQRIPLLENINEGCVICGMKNFDSLRDLDAHIEQHYRGSTPPSQDHHLPNHDQLLAKQLEKQERERMKQKEQEDFQKLQAVYGMDNKGNYNQQTMTNLQEAVSSGQLSVYDYYEKIYEIKMAESKGLDTGESATRDLIEYIRHFSASSPNVIEVHLASPTDHYRSTYGDKGWGCGYRNMQMLMSSMLLQMDYNEHISRVWEVEKGPLPRAWMPSISRLQQHLEKSWSMGIDEPGREQLGGTVYNTKKWIGATEIVAMLTALKIKTRIIDFHKPNGSKNHPEMFGWLYDHFSNRVKQFIPPVYIQHDGHSRTVVGVEKLSDGTILLLVLDPSGHYDKLRTEGGMTTMSHIRKSLHTFKSKQYQLVTVVGIMTNDAEFESSKTIKPFRIP